MLGHMSARSRRSTSRSPRVVRRVNRFALPDGDALAALRSLTSFDSFDGVRDRIVPMLPRIVPPPDSGDPLVTVFLPPGIPVGFGVDLGGSYGTVSLPMLDRWGIDPGALALTALANTRRFGEGQDAATIQEVPMDNVLVRALQVGAGWESALVLVPDELERLFGPGPAIVAVPLRPLVLAFPVADPVVALEINALLADSDPRGLAVEPMLLAGGRLEFLRNGGTAGGWQSRRAETQTPRRLA